MKIVIGSDHAGFQLKERIKKELIKNNSIFDVGTSSEERADYPDYAHLAVEKYKKNNSDRIILICGSGNGIQMALKHKVIFILICLKSFHYIIFF
jgi:RpiB/LacA/LacB family sugar-phosphate isomerase